MHTCYVHANQLSDNANMLWRCDMYTILVCYALRKEFDKLKF